MHDTYVLSMRNQVLPPLVFTTNGHILFPLCTQAFVGLPVAWIDKELRGEAARADMEIRSFIRHGMRLARHEEKVKLKQDVDKAFAGFAIGLVL